MLLTVAAVPNAITRMMSKFSGVFAKARKVKAFGAIKAPDGFYYAHVRKVGMGEEKNKDDPSNPIPVFFVQCCIICNVDGSVDEEYANELVRVRQRIKVSAKMNEQDCLERIAQNLQKLGIDTTTVIGCEEERTSEDETLMADVCSYLSFIGYYVKIEIKRDGDFTNVDLRNVDGPTAMIDVQDLANATGLTDLTPTRTNEEFAEYWAAGGSEVEPEPEQLDDHVEPEAAEEAAPEEAVEYAEPEPEPEPAPAAPAKKTVVPKAATVQPAAPAKKVAPAAPAKKVAPAAVAPAKKVVPAAPAKKAPIIPSKR